MWTRRQNSQEKNVEVIVCDKCKCSWFAQIKVNRYSTFPQSLAMAPIPVHYDADFTMLMCIGCGNVVFPPTEGFMTATMAHELYSEMATEVAGSKEEAEKRMAGIQAEKKLRGVTSTVAEKSKA